MEMLIVCTLLIFGFGDHSVNNIDLHYCVRTHTHLTALCLGLLG